MEEKLRTSFPAIRQQISPAAVCKANRVSGMAFAMAVLDSSTGVHVLGTFSIGARDLTEADALSSGWGNTTACPDHCTNATGM
jgi:hypothetical protein